MTDVVHLERGSFSVQLAPLDLRDLVRDAVETAQYVAEDHELRGDLPTDPVLINGDARRLEQVLLNLVVNAFRHAKSPAGVDVRMRTEEDTGIIEVQDYGPGITSDALPNIFSRFYQAGERIDVRAGLGLGLFIAREIVTNHGGSLVARSAMGEGTIFTIRLPLLQDDVPKESPAALSQGEDELGEGNGTTREDGQAGAGPDHGGRE